MPKYRDARLHSNEFEGNLTKYAKHVENLRFGVSNCQLDNLACLTRELRLHALGMNWTDLFATTLFTKIGI